MGRLGTGIRVREVNGKKVYQVRAQRKEPGTGILRKFPTETYDTPEQAEYAKAKWWEQLKSGELGDKLARQEQLSATTLGELLHRYGPSTVFRQRKPRSCGNEWIMLCAFMK